MYTGDPARLIHHLGLGVWSFLASPASGLVEGARRGAPERIAAGMLDGTRGLITNTVYAFSNATAKMSGAARKVRPMNSLIHHAPNTWHIMCLLMWHRQDERPY